MTALLVLQVAASMVVLPEAEQTLRREIFEMFAAELKIEHADWPVRGVRVRQLGSWSLTPAEVWALLADLLQRMTCGEATPGVWGWGKRT